MKFIIRITCLSFVFFPGSISFGYTAVAVSLKPADSLTYIRIKLKLSNASPAKVSIAPLKYNKHLALSFTLDDGYQSAYLCAFPLLKGGRISPPFPDEWKSDEGGDGSRSAGYFYSDGCGHNIPFRLGLAINGASIRNDPANSGNLTWAEVNEMYKAGWDILNHSYHHSTKHETDYNSEVALNIPSVKAHTGFTMSHFVVPGGPGDAGYHHIYEKAAFANGAYSVASFEGAKPAIAVDKPVNLDHYIFVRDFLKSANDSDYAATKKDVALVDSLMQLPQTTWYTAFTHGVGNSNLWNISMPLPQFRYYMHAIAQKFGVTGDDRIWMAPWQEVYEYIWLRDRTKLSIKQTGQYLTISIARPKLPRDFRNATLSLNISNASKFTVISQSDGVKFTDNGAAAANLLTVRLPK